MSVKMNGFSSHIIDLIDEILKNQELCNLIGQNGNLPVKVPVDPKSISPMGEKERIYAYPFDIDFTDDVRSQLHIYYPSFSFENNANVADISVVFDIVVHKKIWLMMDNKRKVIRAYEIARNIVGSMANKRIGSIGKIHFSEGMHTIINSEFEGVRLVARITDF